MKQHRYIIGMDGGGTKTHAIIADLNGSVRAEHIGGPSNFQIIGVEKAAKTIYDLVKECCDSADCSIGQINAVVLGLTGAGRSADQERMAKGVQRYARSKKTKFKHVMVESDARIALEGAFKGKPGIILIAGTGSIAFGKDSRGNVHRVGGWGRIIGDEGSGYFIGRYGLTAVAHHLDGRGEKTILTKMAEKKFGFTDQTAIINAVYKNGFDVASFAPLVLEGAKKKDGVSRMIVEYAVIQLSEHIRVMAKKIRGSSGANIRSKVHLSLIGGLIANDTILRQLLIRYLQINIPQIEVIPPMSTPAYGAVVLGLEH